MHIEVNATDLFALIVFVLGIVASRIYSEEKVWDGSEVRADGPWSPFDDVPDKTREQVASSGSSTPAAPPPAVAGPVAAAPNPAPQATSIVAPSPVVQASAAHTLSPPSTAPTRTGSPMLSETEDSTFVSRILTNDLLYDIILRSSTPPSLYRIARTCRTAHAAVHSHIGRSFNINKHFAEYFTRPLAFRAMQARTGTLVSGSNALQYLLRETYDDSDLDMYCAYDQREAVGRWLMREEGYRFRPNSRQDPAFGIAVTQARTPADAAAFEFPYSRMKSVAAVYTFSKRVLRPDGGPARWLKVQVIVGYRCAIECILNFHSTAVMNIITATHAYSLYPRATFHHKLSLSMQPPAKIDPHVVTKYTNRGWTFLHEVPSPSNEFLDTLGHVVRYGECEQCTHCIRRREEQRSVADAFPATARWLGDRFSWVLPLDTSGLGLEDSPGLPRDPSFVTSWKMVPRRPRPALLRARRMAYSIVTMHGFAHSYVVGEERLKNALDIVQELWHDPFEEEHSPGVSCDLELVRWAIKVLEERGMWSVWYPD